MSKCGRAKLSVFKPTFATAEDEKYVSCEYHELYSWCSLRVSCVEVNRRDYRAWYGLGQTYEILKMPYYCLHYYKQAQMLRSVASDMLHVVVDFFLGLIPLIL